MKIQIAQNESGKVSVKADGVEISNAITGLSLDMKAGYVPELILKIPAADGVEVDLPYGIIIAEQTE